MSGLEFRIKRISVVTSAVLWVLLLTDLASHVRAANADIADPPKGLIHPGEVEEADGRLTGVGGGIIDVSKVFFQVEEINDNSTTTTTTTGSSVLDIAIFELPETCSTAECDYPSLGVGYIGISENAPGRREMLWCKDSRLKIDDKLFQGHHISANIPAFPQRLPKDYHLPLPNAFKQTQPGHFMVLLANCNKETGRTLSFSGVVEFDNQSRRTKPTKGSNAGGGSLIMGAIVVFGCYRLYHYWMGLANGETPTFTRYGYDNLSFEMRAI